MKAKIFEKFKVYEKQILGADKSNYARFTHNEFLEFAKVVEEWRGKPLTSGEKSCNRCLLTLLKTIAKDYKTYMAKKAKKDAEADESKEG